MNRRVALFAPAATIAQVRQDVLTLAPDLAGLTVPIAPNSTSLAATHFGGEGIAPADQIAELSGILGLTWGYIGEGPEGVTYYEGFDELLGAFNLVRWQDPNDSPI